MELEECELFLSEMIINKEIYGRIDRPNGIVNFIKPQYTNSILTNWAGKIDVDYR